MNLKRSSGILLHITSLPGKYGIGDFGTEAYQFLQFLKNSGHTWWQILPLNPTEGVYNHSPYSSYSAFAGNILMISPELLEKDGYLKLENFPLPSEIESEKVIFDAVETYKRRLLDEAFLHFQHSTEKKQEYLNFLQKHEIWLEDYCLYVALKERFNDLNWTSWPAEFRDREPAALQKAREALQPKIEREKFIQFIFFSQWEILLEKAHELGIKILGDVPFYVNHDSADCWANPEFFKLDTEKKSLVLSGVPPDMFSKTGQLWGTPVYNWPALKEQDYGWWIDRLRQNLLLFDVVRIDHFRAFAAAWEVPAGDKTAVGGKWVATPGTDFFETVKKLIPKMPFIAEDLGVLDQPVYDLLDKFSFPRMKVLQFAFGEMDPKNPYLPHNHDQNCVVYTGTHDNNTSRGWLNRSEPEVKQQLEEYTGQIVLESDVHRLLHRMALQSVADLAIIPLQDLVGLGEEALMNIPGTTTGNWSWRARRSDIPFDRATEFYKLNKMFGRVPEK